ncbi:hypothetical protein [Thioflavicoccus mobilis]|nr:hypothetical protein [Thioflavicoccus mobilis]
MPLQDSSPFTANSPRHLGLLPDFCSPPMILGVAITAEPLSVVLTLANGDALTRFWARLASLSL